MQAPAFAARCMKKSPAHTRHSLFASATVAPRSTAASAGFNPAAPLMAAMTQSDGRAAASMIALSPAPHSMRVPAKASFNSASRPGSATAAKRAPNSFANLARPSTLALAVKASTRYRSREARSKSIVLSPIEPVAPKTVTARTADAEALLLRNGTALIFSPNHKTAADAIHAAPQKSQNRRQDHRRDKAVETIEQSAMSGNDLAGVLDVEPAFHCRFKQIAELGNNGKRCAQHQQGAGSGQTEHRKSRRDNKARSKAADGASPCLPGTAPRPELRPADAPASEIAANIGHPHHQKDQNQRDKSPELIEAHQHRRHLCRRRIAKSYCGPAAPLRRQWRNAGEAQRQ